MTVWFVSRHPGAVEWARRQGLCVDRWVPHLDLQAVGPEDTVVGTLPVQLTAEVCRRGARYLHLSVDMLPQDRGRELSADDLASRNARLEAYEIFSFTRTGTS